MGGFVEIEVDEVSIFVNGVERGDNIDIEKVCLVYEEVEKWL